ncbi:MAG: hypothetical protein JJU20_00875 [Opitutales bacterium]|nr:hypothetical protein [Opitutales bacterium]
MEFDLFKLTAAIARINGDRNSDWSLTNALLHCDQVARDPETPLDPHLRHYLQRRSYVKAAAFLQQPASQHTATSPNIETQSQ